MPVLLDERGFLISANINRQGQQGKNEHGPKKNRKETEAESTVFPPLLSLKSAERILHLAINFNVAISDLLKTKQNKNSINNN